MRSIIIRPCAGVVLLFLLATAPVIAKKKAINPEDFDVVANVVEVSSQEQATDVTTTHPVLPDFCGDPKGTYQKTYCRTAAAGGDVSTSTNETVYVMTAEIGDKLYDLRGPRIELGTYHLRFAEGSRHRFGVEFLLKDRKGRPVAVWYLIVRERFK